MIVASTSRKRQTYSTVQYSIILFSAPAFIEGAPTPTGRRHPGYSLEHLLRQGQHYREEEARQRFVPSRVPPLFSMFGVGSRGGIGYCQTRVVLGTGSLQELLLSQPPQHHNTIVSRILALSPSYCNVQLCCWMCRRCFGNQKVPHANTSPIIPEGCALLGREASTTTIESGLCLRKRGVEAPLPWPGRGQHHGTQRSSLSSPKYMPGSCA